ncbi:MAG: TlpA family protein disulfide reductase [Muribaculaceae bacterium]|nr:TlpA family protein disulfide reductase [Muribaculaceae bacterium]
MDSINRLILLRDLELLKARPVGMVWIDKAKDIALMSQRLKIDIEDLKSMYANLDDSIKNTRKGKAIYGYLYPESHIEVGDKFPDTLFNDINGNVHKFSEFEGKWCLVDFWNSGCAPCIRALPELRELKEEYPDALELISLSIDSEKIWQKASEELHLTGNNWNEGKENYGIFRRLHPLHFIF